MAVLICLVSWHVWQDKLQIRQSFEYTVIQVDSILPVSYLCYSNYNLQIGLCYVRTSNSAGFTLGILLCNTHSTPLLIVLFCFCYSTRDPARKAKPYITRNHNLHITIKWFECRIKSKPGGDLMPGHVQPRHTPWELHTLTGMASLSDCVVCYNCSNWMIPMQLQLYTWTIR